MKKSPKKLMSAPWQVQTAKANFSEVFRRARNEGPQLIVKQGNEAVVMIPAEQFEALVASSNDKPTNLVEFFRNSPLVGLLVLWVVLACPPMSGAGQPGNEVKAMSVTESDKLVTCVPSEWSGKFHHPQWQFAARMQLLPFTSASDNTVRGQIIWTMERSPKPEEQSKIGLSAIEYVSGEFDSARKQLTLNGDAISDPHNLHIALDSYSFSLSADGQSMEGSTTAHTDGLGRITLSRQSSADDAIVIRSELPVPLDTAWKMWTDAASVKTWLCEDATIGSKVGDPYELFWEPEHRDRNSTIGCKIGAVDIGRSICFNWKGPVPYADVMNVSPAPTYVVVAFRPVGKEQTLVVLQHGGWGKGPQWAEARKWQEQAWRKAIGCLKSHCN